MKLKQLSADRISRLALYVVVGVTAVVYGLFLLIGYNAPLDTDPSFVAPLLTPLLISFVELIVVVAVVTAIWMGVARWRSIKASHTVDSARSLHVVLGVVLGTVVIMILGFVLGSTTPIMANGSQYTDSLWLRIADMFIYSGTALVIVAAVAAAVLKGKK